ncbi:MAG TPA: transcriptional repressor [Acidimicrobiales bacterium]
MDVDLHETAAIRLRNHEQRYTANRRAIVEVLAAAERPLTVPEVLERGDRMPQSSAYRNMALLEAAGLVHRILGGDEYARYELDEDLTDHHHHHLICSTCGAIEDVTLPGALEASIESALNRAARRRGFAGEQHRVDLVGVCARCR